MLVYNSILDYNQAQEIADDLNISVEEAAKKWFEETFEGGFDEEEIKYKKYICEIPYIGCDLYYDYGANYYFCVKSEKIKESKKTSKQLIRLTEGDLHKIIKESVNNILEDNDYVKYPKYSSPYDDKNKNDDFQTKPLKSNTNLQHVRARIANIRQALTNNKIEDAKKQTARLYKLVDSMINQGF